MKTIKGYISNLHIDYDMSDAFSFGLDIPVATYINKTTAKAEIIFTEGDLSELMNLMSNHETVELEISPSIGRKTKTKWRMIRMDE